MVSSTVQHLTLYGVPLQLYSQLAVWQVLPLSPFNKLENSGGSAETPLYSIFGHGGGVGHWLWSRINWVWVQALQCPGRV